MEYARVASGDNLGDLSARVVSLLLALALALLQGCVVVGPDYTPPEPELPDAWHQELTKGLAAGEASLQTWWTVLNDPLLNSLIERADKSNLDLKQAVARIRQARARLGIVTGERYPDLDGTGSYELRRFSEEVFIVPPTGERTDDFFSFGVASSWELDFWGRIRRSIESADAGLQASIEDYRDVLVLLYADVASNYVQARTLQARIQFAANNVQIQRDTLKLTTDRFNAGLVSELDVRQAELNLATTESVIPLLQRLLVQAINRVGVLLGEPPSALHEELAPPAPIPKSLEETIVSLPADLLRQRPDIRRAERALAAQTAQIGVATADLYPRFVLLGDLSVQATGFTDLFTSSAVGGGVGPGFSWKLFSGGRVRSNITLQDALTEETRFGYEQTVLGALEDVENALAAYTRERDRRNALARTVAAAQKSVVLVRTRYILGIADFQNVLDMERSLFTQQDQLAESEGEVTQNLIRLYKALGGGWAIQ